MNTVVFVNSTIGFSENIKAFKSDEEMLIGEFQYLIENSFC